MATVYLVTSGQYSGYTVCMAFTHKEDAERHVAEWNASGDVDKWNARRVEECELHDGPLPVVARLCCSFGTDWRGTGPYVKGERMSPATRQEPDVEVWRSDNPLGTPYLLVSGTDHERVRKVFTEQLAGFKLQHNIP